MKKRNLLMILCLLTLQLVVNAQDRIYWGVSSSNISSAKFDGTDIQQAVAISGQTYDMETDFYKGVLYWGDSRSVKKANTDGTSIQTLYTGSSTVGGLALDLTNNKLYFTEYGGGTNIRITRCNTDGTGLETIYTSANSGETYTLSISTTLQKLYWTERNSITNNYVRRCNLDGTNVETLMTTTKFIPGLTIDEKNQKLYLAYYNNNEVRTTDMTCSTEPTLVFGSSNGTFQMAVNNIDNKLYFAELATRKIRKCNLDGTSPQDIITVTGSPMALSIPTVPPAPTINANETYTFKIGDFLFSSIDKDLLTKIQITATVSKGTMYLDANNDNIVDAGESVTLNQEISRTDIDGGKLKFNPVTDEIGSSYTAFKFKWYDGTSYSVLEYDQKIYVLAFKPTVTTQAVSNINSTTAIGNGTISNLGVPNATAYGICWSTSGSPTTSNSNIDKGAATATGAFTTSITGLTAGTTYHVRAYATNTEGTAYGNEVTFTTTSPTITSATYDAGSGILILSCQDINSGDIINPTKITLTGEGSETYTLTTGNVTASSSTSASITLNATDRSMVNMILNKNGTASTNATTYNLAAADDWNATLAAADIADLTGNGITVSNVAVPAISSAIYDAASGSLVVSGSGFLKLAGASNDIDISKLTITGEGGVTYTLTSSSVEITSGSAFTVSLNPADVTNLKLIINKNGTSSTEGTTYNLAAAENWASGADAAVVVADLTGNGVTVSNVAVPIISSATYDAASGALVVSGSGFLKLGGAANDIDVSKLTITGEGGTTYTLTSSSVEITSGTEFTVSLNSTDIANINPIVNKNGTSATGGTTYNLAAAEDWASGADAAVVVADLTGNGITVSNIAIPLINSATYDVNNGILVVSGSGFIKLAGAANDIDVSKLSITGEGGATYTLTSPSVEITSNSAFTVSLNSADIANLRLIINKSGTSSTGGTTYNLAAAEDWASGADVAVVVADLTGNGITVSNACSNNPTDGGTIAASQAGCNPFDPTELTNTALPSGYTGTLEYKWQSSTTSSSAGFTDITNSNASSYDPGLLTQTTWFKRLARINCKSDWTDAAESNTITITVHAIPASPVSSNNTYTYDGTTKTATAIIGNTETVVWYASINGTNSISTPTAINAGTYSAYAEAKNATTGCVSERREIILSINKKPLTITATGPAKTYGTALSATTSTTNFTADATGVGTETVTSVTLTPNAAGSTATTATGTAYAVTPSSATGTGGFFESNYNITYVAYNGTVGKKILTITADSKTKSYGSQNPELTFTYSGFIGGDNVNSLDIKPVAKTNINEKTPTGVYSGAIYVEGGNDDMYDFQYVSGDFSVTNAILSVYAKAKVKCYDGSTFQPPFEVTYSGFVNGQDKDDLKGKLVFSGPALTNSEPGEYIIIPSGQTSTNYTIHYYLATCIIESPITLSISGKTTISEKSREIYTADATMAQYNWSVSNGGTIVSGNGTNQIEVLWNTFGDQTVSLSCTNTAGCSGSNSLEVSVEALPTAIISGDATIKPGANTEISVALTGKAPWSVTFSDGTLQKTIHNISEQVFKYAINPVSTATYTVTQVKDARGYTNAGTGKAVITVITISAGSIADDQSIASGTKPAAITSVSEASSDFAITYGWEQSLDTGNTWVVISGANKSGYSPDILTKTTWFRRIASSTFNGVVVSTETLPVKINVWTTGIDDVVVGSLKAYSYQNKEIRIEGRVSRESVAQLYDLQGRLIVTKKLGEGELNIIPISLKPSVYLLNVKDGNKQNSFKVVFHQ